MESNHHLEKQQVLDFALNIKDYKLAPSPHFTQR